MEPAMNAAVLHQRIRTYQARLNDLLTSRPLSIAELLAERGAHNAPGVYVLFTPADDQPVYAGRTKTQSIAARVRDHRDAGTASDLGGMLKRNPELPRPVDKYLVRYTTVTDARDRLFFEAFVIGCLAPPLNK